ncbi:TetR/AcrR family transcriptional regulator [Viridibacillus sp. NPDC093762]|uniref:TetR/AcrR family transcriptional regulator n=1 Tax=Viridibacillus sp. NPDC093762 TaxID=3390720 RepID=UPI003D0881DC
MKGETMSNQLFDMILSRGETKKRTEKQKKIIENAIKLFAQKGYANTSTAEIAKAAEVSEGTIFKHYGTKDQLLLSIILPFIKDFFPTMVHEVIKETFLPKTVTFEQFLKRLLKNRAEFIFENRDIFLVVIKEIIYKDELKNEVFPYFFEKVPPILGKVIDEFKARGEIVDLPHDRILKMLATVIGGFFVSRFILLDNYRPNNEDIDDIVRVAVYGLSTCSSV